jgi:glycosyltransferase involved in cell wall biosynthesis
MKEKPRIAVVSPSLDKRHGTERRVSELVERLARNYNYEVHIYSQRVEDITNVKRYTVSGSQIRQKDKHDPGVIWWHYVPGILGFGLLRYIWWFVANHFYRWYDQIIRGLEYDLVYTPGVNCLNADVVSVHVVFTKFYQQVNPELALHSNPLRMWPWLIHRQLLYRIFIALEHIIYSQQKQILTAISYKTRQDLIELFNRTPDLPVIYHGLDLYKFNPHSRMSLRSEVRQTLRLPEHAVALLLIGNDWKNKGLPVLLKAMNLLHRSDLWLLVVGSDQQALYQALIDQYALRERVLFLPPRPDVESYYAAADIYVAPSLEDAFALPPAEAMACGVPVIVSSRAGVSEIVTHGADGLVLRDPTSADELAELIHQLCEDSSLLKCISKQSIQTAQNYTWKSNAVKMHMLFQETIRRKLLSKRSG